MQVSTLLHYTSTPPLNFLQLPADQSTASTHRRLTLCAHVKQNETNAATFTVFYFIAAFMTHLFGPPAMPVCWAIFFACTISFFIFIYFIFLMICRRPINLGSNEPIFMIFFTNR